MIPLGSKHVEIFHVILQYKCLRNNTVHFVGLSVVNWLWTMQGINIIKQQ
jgi:hypothetical protein